MQYNANDEREYEVKYFSSTNYSKWSSSINLYQQEMNMEF